MNVDMDAIEGYLKPSVITLIARLSEKSGIQ